MNCCPLFTRNCASWLPRRWLTKPKVKPFNRPHSFTKPGSNSERAAFLAGACGHDATLRQRVESLLAAHEQAKGFLRERFDISVDEAFLLLRRYAHAHGDHLTDVARQLMAEPGARPALLHKMTQLA